jgi:hypothetical protein
MAHKTTPDTQLSERPLPGICLDCGQGYTPRVAYATKCYSCWRAARAAQAPVDERSQRHYRHRENKDGTATPALSGDTRGFALPLHLDGSVPAWRANLARAKTLRLRAQKAAGEEARLLHIAAWDAERLARAQQRDEAARAWDAAQAVPVVA